MDWKTYIHSAPKILLGKPVIRGTRLSAEFILGLFAEGWTEQQVWVGCFPEHLKRVFFLQWGYDPATERLTVLGGDASLGLVPGLSLSAGTYKDVLCPPQIVTEAERQIEVKESIPKSDNPPPITDMRIVLSVDLMKFKPGELLRQIKSIF